MFRPVDGSRTYKASFTPVSSSSVLQPFGRLRGYLLDLLDHRGTVGADDFSRGIIHIHTVDRKSTYGAKWRHFFRKVPSLLGDQRVGGGG